MLPNYDFEVRTQIEKEDQKIEFSRKRRAARDKILSQKRYRERKKVNSMPTSVRRGQRTVSPLADRVVEPRIKLNIPFGLQASRPGSMVQTSKKKKTKKKKVEKKKKKEKTEFEKNLDKSPKTMKKSFNPPDPAFSEAQTFRSK